MLIVNDECPFNQSTSQSSRDDIISGRYPIVNSINNSRYPAYHRLDLSLESWSVPFRRFLPGFKPGDKFAG